MLHLLPSERQRNQHACAGVTRKATLARRFRGPSSTLPRQESTLRVADGGNDSALLVDSR